MQWSISLRPTTLSNMAGAEKVKNYFYNIKKQGKDFPTGILFRGQFGMGKTTAAKIVAQMIVCQSPKDNGDPCCECPSCKAIIDEKYNRDVIQIDPATLRADAGGSIASEFAKRITDFVSTPPMRDKAKVVLVEEAQELSGDAQKNLLKILEQPRKNVHIILTSMINNGGKKLPPALISRCQRFDFTQATISELMTYLGNTLSSMPEVMNNMPDLSKEEYFKFLEIISLNSSGSYRQALQTLEQCIDAGIYTSAEIQKNLGLTDQAGFYQTMRDLLDAKLSNESFETLMNGDANTVATTFALSYKVISDAECFRLFNKVPNVDNDNEFFTRQARGIAFHKNFPYMRDIFKHFAETENLSPSNYKLMICQVFDYCKNNSSAEQNNREEKIISTTEPIAEEKIIKHEEPVSNVTTPAPAVRRVIRR